MQLLHPTIHTHLHKCQAMLHLLSLGASVVRPVETFALADRHDKLETQVPSLQTQSQRCAFCSNASMLSRVMKHGSDGWLWYLQTGYIDYDKLEEKAMDFRAQDAHLQAARAYPREWDYKRLYEDRAEGRRAAHVRTLAHIRCALPPLVAGIPSF